MRKFGIEIETCVVVEYNSEFLWINYVEAYLNKVFENWKLNTELILYTQNFDNKIIIKTEKHNSEANFFIFDLITNSLSLSSEIYEIDYNYPTIAPDYSIICHDYAHGFINHTLHPSEWNEKSQNAVQYGLTQDLFSINIELISQIMDSFGEYELFKKLMMPKTLSFLINKSQGIHLNIDISDIPTSKLKDILIKHYYPWERANARKARPNKSIYARELEYQDIIKMEKFRTLDQFITILTKDTSVHLKLNLEVIEFRIFSPSGNNIDKYIHQVYNFFENKKSGGKRNTKKLKKKTEKTNKTKKNIMKLLFVYGSLRKGFANNHRLEKAKFIGYCETKKKYYMVGKLSSELDSFEDGRAFSYPPRTFLYPYVFTEKLRNDCELCNIIGELYEVDNKLLQKLDIFEGHPSIYMRKQIHVVYNDLSLKSNIYLLNNKDIEKDIKDNKNLYIPVTEDWHTAAF